MTYAAQDHHRKKIRLDPAVYAQVGLICSVTIAVTERRPVFSNPTAASQTVEVLSQLSSRHGNPVYGYCVMPDHVHLVLGPSPTCDIVTFVGQFKNLSQRAVWRQGITGSFWQKSFWDHFVRADEGVNRAVTYVLENPVRRGLASHWGEYPYAGSLELKL
jgi:REP element-mobilizing transposase RayT